MAEKKGRHVGIAMPCQDQIDSLTALDLYKAGVHHAFACPDDDQHVSMMQTAFLAEARNKLVKDLLERGCDYIIFIDSDMRFPQTLYHDLMLHDLPVVAANCAKRRRPISATARKEADDDPSNLVPVWPDPEIQDGVEKVHVVGSAIMCIKKEVFFEIEYPWFLTPYIKEEDRLVGEDLYFCGQLKRAGIGLYIDHHVSWQVGHIGQYVYRMNDVIAEREAARAGMWDHIKPQIENANGQEAIVLATK